MPINKRLGKGIEALISTYDTQNVDNEINATIKIKNIIPNKEQPRKEFNNKSMKDLIDSIREKGIIQPLTVRNLNNGTFELIAGERRFRAAKFLKMKTVPVYVLSVEANVNMLELALVENIQRENLNPLEEAEGFALLSGKYGLTQKEISEKVGKSRSEVANTLRLMKLPPNIRKKIALNVNNGGISKGHARAILSLKSSIKMQLVFKKIIDRGLSVRQTEEIVRNILTDKKSNIRSIVKSSKLIQIEQELTEKLNSKSIIKKNKSGKGSINIGFSSMNELNRIVKKIIK